MLYQHSASQTQIMPAILGAPVNRSVRIAHHVFSIKRPPGFYINEYIFTELLAETPVLAATAPIVDVGEHRRKSNTDVSFY